jgi:hypothetical protein
MERTPTQPCQAQIAFISTGEIDTSSKFGQRKNLQSGRDAYIECEAEGCGLVAELPGATDSDIEVFLTDNCKLIDEGQEIMIR